MKLMYNKQGIITGVINKHSIAWIIANALHNQGANIILVCHKQVMESVSTLAEFINADVIEADICSSNGILKLINNTQIQNGIDFFVYGSMINTTSHRYKERFIDVDAKIFSESMLTSCYSLIGVCHALESYFNLESSVLALTFEGARRTFSNYNVMGAVKAALEASVRYLALDLGRNQIRINALSTGINQYVYDTEISENTNIFTWTSQNSPMGRQPTLEEIGNSAMYLLSNLASGVTGEIHHVDCGYHTIGSIGTYYRKQ